MCVCAYVSLLHTLLAFFTLLCVEVYRPESGTDNRREHGRRRHGNISVEKTAGPKGPLTAAPSRLPDRGALDF